MANPLKLPFDFPPNSTPTTQQLQANFNALLAFVQNLNDGLATLANLLVTTLTTTSTATIGGTLAATGAINATGDVTASSTILLANGSVTVPALRFTNSTSSGLYRLGSSNIGVSTGGTNAWAADSLQNISQPLQPAFLATRAAAFGNSQTGDTDPHVFNNEAYDVGGNYASNVFTAPVTGKYFLAFSVNLGPRAGTPATFFTCRLFTSNQGYPIFKEAPTTDESVTMSVIADMDAGDIAKVVIDVSTGATTWVSEVDALSYFTGTLIN